MQVPKVSVIVPCYQHAAFLRERMESIFAQTFQDFEVILLDDASTDGSADILKEYRSDPRVSHLVIEQKNSGSACAQWRKGMGLARGELIWIAESDDSCEREFLSELVPMITGKVGSAYCRSQRIDEKGRPAGDWYWPDGLDPKLWKKDFVHQGIHLLQRAMVYRNVVPNASACIFRKDLVRWNDRILTMRFAGDWIFWAELMSRCDVSYTAQRLSSFRKHGNSTRERTDMAGEIRRFQEYAEAIEAVMSMIGPDPVIDHSKYEWIFQEARAKTRSLKEAMTLMAPFPLPIKKHFEQWYRSISILGKIRNLFS
jgi:glycosyltransferase involved in cell wall biosynthesis